MVYRLPDFCISLNSISRLTSGFFLKFTAVDIIRSYTSVVTIYSKIVFVKPLVFAVVLRGLFFKPLVFAFLLRGLFFKPFVFELLLRGIPISSCGYTGFFNAFHTLIAVGKSAFGLVLSPRCNLGRNLLGISKHRTTIPIFWYDLLPLDEYLYSAPDASTTQTWFANTSLIVRSAVINLGFFPPTGGLNPYDSGTSGTTVGCVALLSGISSKLDTYSNS